MLYNGFVYLAKSDTGHYKIGRSKNPYGRIKHFDTIMPVKVEIVHYFPCDDPVTAERLLHHRYSNFHTTGEWFNFCDAAEYQICRIMHFLNDEFVFQMSDEPWQNSCCYEAIQEAIRRHLVIDVDDDIYEIHARSIRRPRGWFGENDQGDNQPPGKWHSNRIINEGQMTHGKNEVVPTLLRNIT